MRFPRNNHNRERYGSAYDMEYVRHVRHESRKRANVDTCPRGKVRLIAAVGKLLRRYFFYARHAVDSFKFGFGQKIVLGANSENIPPRMRAS